MVPSEHSTVLGRCRSCPVKEQPPSRSTETASECAKSSPLSRPWTKRGSILPSASSKTHAYAHMILWNSSGGIEWKMWTYDSY